ncbi:MULTISPECIES: SAM-dependent methyltransferase [unclassified Microbacterium]|uniref:SAM-dependent methyltransferase n=1 Tax=unclassified Microbacterium TaxID=2609290 RepID=UPI00386B03D3
MWPFLYFAGERLSTAELTAARLDGDVIELGEGFIPADAVETREMRAASLRSLTGPHRAVTHASAAWVHGAIDEPPLVHAVQRASPTRTGFPLDLRVHFRDLQLPVDDVVALGGVLVTTPVRTFVDLIRAHVSSPPPRGAGMPSPGAVATAMRAADPGLASAAVAWLERSGPIHHKRAALDHLRQDVVTR